MSSSIQNLDHLKIPLEDILEATNHFSNDNFIRQGGFGKIYKGQLKLSSGKLIDIVARRLDAMYGQGSKEFWTEVSMLSSLKHDNLVSIVGFCDEKNEKIVINKYEAKGSLDNYLSDATLTWLQRLQICIGVAHALNYIHYDEKRDFSVIHRNIKSSKILLDENYEPKLAGFELSMTTVASRKDQISFTDTCGTIGYVDPIYVKTSGVTHKSDMYSFGVVLFEVLFGRKAIINKRDMKLAQVARSHYEERKLDDLIDPHLRKQMDQESFDIFAETAYYCLKEQRAERPNIDQVISRLKKALVLQRKHEKPVDSLAAGASDRWKDTKLEYLKVGLREIKIATNNFNDGEILGRGGYCTAYRAKLDVCDFINLLELEGSKCEPPKRSATVAIKRYHTNKGSDYTYIDQLFINEIETISSCKHGNTVSLLGFCNEESEKITVYEYASNGTLAGYLENDSRFMKKFAWLQRIKLCIDIAHGLNYIHTRLEDKQKIIHRNIKSGNILLNEDWEAMIDGSALCMFQPLDSLYADHIAGTATYLDPEYEATGKIGEEVDIYSFGVVLFESYCGRLAYDRIYTEKNEKGLAPVVRQCFEEGTLHEMVDPYLKEKANENVSIEALNQDSVKTFLQIAYQCLHETQNARPTMQVVIKELEKALNFQENNKDNFRISLDELESATKDFRDLIGKGGFGQVYRGEVTNAIGHNIIAVKRLDRKSNQGDIELMTELDILKKYKHENVIGLVGYCDEMGEKIIVYEFASRGSLDRWLKHNELTWRRRLAICIDIASGLDFLHGISDVKQEVVIHRDIKTANILLHGDWKAKIADFGLSLISPINQEMSYTIDNAKGTPGYCDPKYITTSMLTKESDIYSFGVLLFEILCGRFVMEYNNRNLVDEVRRYYEEGRLDEMVFEAIKKQMVQESLIAFQEIAYNCIHKEREDRPTANDVLIQLKKALQFQDDRDIWEPKLPKDYQQLIQMSSSPKIYSDMSKMDFYKELFKGILLQKGRQWFSLGTNEERNVMTSATKFTYKNRRSHKWGSIPESRFQKVAELLDLLNLNIRIKIRTKLLSPGVTYGVYLVFKFGDPSKTSSRPMYVNLTYKRGNETLHSYFATSRDEWMMIELSRFLNHEEEAYFEVLLESFSRCYCGTGAIYVEGVEFRAIDNVKLEKVKKLKGAQQVLKPRSNIYEVKQLQSDEGEKLLSTIRNVKGTKHHMVSAKEAIYDSSKVKHFTSKPSAAESRFEEVIEVLRHQVLHIKCKIQSQTMSTDTEYACYLVFMLSETCCGLHCPVIVRDLLDWKNKRSGLLYLRSPSALNQHDIDQVPEQREDGLMEVIVWKFNSNSKSRNGYVPVNLKLISYEGTMSGLIVYGLEFRPM